MSAFDLAAVQKRLREFAAARNWEQFHNPKNLATALVVEAAELTEVFQWRTLEQSELVALDEETRARIADEVADVCIYLARFADVAGVDLGAVVAAKIDRNEERFPRSTSS